MTNGAVYQKLATEEKVYFRRLYNDHPLFGFIDWQAFYESENGNAMDFVFYQEKFQNKYGQTVYVLQDLISENNEDYKLIYICEEDAFYKVPAPASKGV